MELLWDIKIHTYFSFILHTQININYKKFIKLFKSILSHFTVMYMPKNL